jgi:hypothetical protein
MGARRRRPADLSRVSTNDDTYLASHAGVTEGISVVPHGPCPAPLEAGILRAGAASQGLES